MKPTLALATAFLPLAACQPAAAPDQQAATPPGAVATPDTPTATGDDCALTVERASFVNLAALQPARGDVSTMLLDDEQLRAAIQAAGVSTSDHVIVSGDNITAATRGFFILDYLGHPRVSLLDGG